MPGTPFVGHITQDGLGRQITYYIANDNTGRTPLPLVVWVQGTGCSSLFGRDGDRITQGPAILLHEALHGRGLVMAVEKPGVEFLDHQPDAANSRTCRAEFLREHTLDRWAEAIAASIRAAQKLPGVDGSRTLVIGGSEGGLVAVRVSNVLPTVTHAASLAGGGPVHLFDLSEYVRRKGLDPEKEVYSCWQEILRDPDNPSRFCWGHTFRMQSSFMKTSLIEECLHSNAQLYLAHGTADEQNFIAGFDIMHAELAAKKRAAVFDRIEGADHEMNRVGQSPPAGLVEIFGRIVDWFLKN